MIGTNATERGATPLAEEMTTRRRGSPLMTATSAEAQLITRQRERLRCNVLM